MLANRFFENELPAHNLFAKVILPFNLDRPYSYFIPTELIGQIIPGIRVEVQFGRSKIYAGMVCEVYQELEIPSKYKSIISVLDTSPIIYETQLKLWFWIAEYYCCSIGDVMAAALPAGFKLDSESKISLHSDFNDDFSSLSDDEYLIAEALSINRAITVDDVQKIVNKKSVKKIIDTLVAKGVILVEEELKSGLKEKKEDYLVLDEKYRVNTEFLNQALDLVSKSDLQTQIVLAFIQYARGNHEITRKEINNHVITTAAALKQLEKKGILKLEKRPVKRNILTKLDTILPPLSTEQAEAIEKIKSSFEAGTKVSLVHGVTGSGKTRIYSEFIHQTVEAGDQVLYLLPEIALTTHLISRLRKSLGNQLNLYHSRVSQRERIETWKNVQEGASVTIAARSGIFLPFKNLKLIIIDEEHDPSYKQNEPSPRYQARDAAVWLAHICQAQVILGSATPSLESWQNAMQNKYAFAQLKNRFSDIPLPEYELVDLYVESKARVEPFILGKALHDAMSRALRQKEQILLFQNRRGYAPQQHCDNCHWHAECPNCDIGLTYHKYLNKLICHYCNYQRPLFENCPDCGKSSIQLKGFGTEKIEDTLTTLFPDAKIGRLDHDTANTISSYQDILDKFETKQIDILVGTQMISKGLDFDHVAIAAILQADSIFYYPDFRSNERAFQLITQVAGRAGRKNIQGKVFLQAYNLNHDIIKHIINYDYESMVKKEIEDRSTSGYPPFVKLIELTVKHKKPELADRACLLLADLLQAKYGNRVSDPLLPGIARLRNLYLRNIIIKIERNHSLLQEIKKVIKEFIPIVTKTEGLSTTRLTIDVDP